MLFNVKLETVTKMSRRAVAKKMSKGEILLHILCRISSSVLRKQLVNNTLGSS